MHPFKKNVKYQQLGEDIYLIENFLNPQEAELFKKHIDKDFADRGIFMVMGGAEISNPILKIEEIRTKLVDIINPEYGLGKSTAVNRMNIGKSWGEHADCHDFVELRKKSKLKDPLDEYDVVNDTKFGLVVYFNEFGGGEIYYPRQNIQYHPKPGDLVVHSSEENCFHGVKEVTEGYRYSYSGFLSVPMTVPRNL